MHSMNDTLRSHLQVAVSLLKTLRGKAVSKAFPLRVLVRLDCLNFIST